MIVTRLAFNAGFLVVKKQSEEELKIISPNLGEEFKRLTSEKTEEGFGEEDTIAMPKPIKTICFNTGVLQKFT